MNSEKIMESLIKGKNRKVVKEESEPVKATTKDLGIDLEDMSHGLEEYFNDFQNKINSLSMNNQLKLMEEDNKFFKKFISFLEYYQKALDYYFNIKKYIEKHGDENITMITNITRDVFKYDESMKEMENILRVIWTN